MVVLLGMAGLVIDVGSWYRDQRDLQADADAAALAGAQELPNDTATAASWHSRMRKRTATTSPPPESRFWRDGAERLDHDQGQGAVADVLHEALRDQQRQRRREGDGEERPPRRREVRRTDHGQHHAHHCSQGAGAPASNTPTTLPLSKLSAPGAFGLLDLDNGKGNGASMLGSWIRGATTAFCLSATTRPTQAPSSTRRRCRMRLTRA